MTPEEARAKAALAYVVPKIESLGLKWIITGGFACYAYGVKRSLTDIDIDIDTSKESPEFKQLYEMLQPKITQPLEHFVDKNYDNYNFEITVMDVVVDICPMREMNVFDKISGTYVNFYLDGYRTETVDFHGMLLPLLAKDLVIKNKEMLVWQRDSDLADIAALKAI